MYYPKLKFESKVPLEKWIDKILLILPTFKKRNRITDRIYQFIIKLWTAVSSNYRTKFKYVSKVPLEKWHNKISTVSTDIENSKQSK